MDEVKPAEASVTAEPASGAGPPPPDLAVECERWKAENQELNSRWLYLRAEFDNFRRRSARDQAETYDRAAREMVLALLPVVDDFERALAHETSDPEYARGVELIHQRLMDTLGKAGLEPIDAKGKTFDPNVHEAMGTVPAAEVDDHTVFDELRRGYNFRGRLLRPAMVRVAVRPAEIQ